jgi:hypothetical protein
MNDVYKEQGYSDREDYFRHLADYYCLDLWEVVLLAELLGPSEDFDGLVSALEDEAMK